MHCWSQICLGVFADVHTGWQCIRCKVPGSRARKGGGLGWLCSSAEQQGAAHSVGLVRESFASHSACEAPNLSENQNHILKQVLAKSDRLHEMLCVKCVKSAGHSAAFMRTRSTHTSNVSACSCTS